MFIISKTLNQYKQICSTWIHESSMNFSRRTVGTKVITTFLSLILTLNNFLFNCKNYLQIKGCVMGTICAPAYANIFMDHFERKYISSVIRQKGESQNACFKKTKHAKFYEKWTFLTPWYAHAAKFKSLNTRYHNQVIHIYTYTQRFIGKKQTEKSFYILVQSTLYH